MLSMIAYHVNELYVWLYTEQLPWTTFDSKLLGHCLIGTLRYSHSLTRNSILNIQTGSSKYFSSSTILFILRRKVVPTHWSSRFFQITINWTRCHYRKDRSSIDNFLKIYCSHFNQIFETTTNTCPEEIKTILIL